MFQWDDANRNHVPPERGISPSDCEEIFADPRSMTREAHTRGGERRWSTVGATSGGRIIVVIDTLREGLVRVVTAYPASGRPEERAYRRQSW